MTPPAKAHILLVDDDQLFAESVQTNLTDVGYDVSVFTDGRSALRYLGTGGNGDVLLLDWKMPGMDGIEVLRRMRGRNLDIPVIFLTVLSDQKYEEASLLGGAVDFVEKSRSFSILLRRVQLVLDAKSGGPEDMKAVITPLQVGFLDLNPGSARASWQGKPVELTLTEFKVVEHLATRAGRDVRYRELYDVMRGEGFHGGNGENGYRVNVRTMIKRVRQKFSAIDEKFDRIENYPEFGYRWRAPEP